VRIISGGQYDNTLGTGDNISMHRLQNLAWHGGIIHRITPSFQYHLHLRKEIHSLYHIPWVMALDAKWKVMDKHAFRINYSSNYRSPTLNDLYWIGGGNPDLIPENSRSFELGYEYDRVTGPRLSLSAYYTRSRDLIQWQPGSSGFWHPVNVHKVRIAGIEIEGGIPYRWSSVSGQISGYFHYTRSEDELTGKTLMYNPRHSAGGEEQILYRQWELLCSYHYTGRVYTTTTETNSLPGYGIYGVELSKIFRKPKISLSGKIRNIFDVHYQVMPGYPMPGRHYALQIKYQY
jgi:iron complex outermembrane receptor protein